MKKILKFVITVEIEETDEVDFQESEKHAKWVINKAVDELDCEYDGITASVDQVN